MEKQLQKNISYRLQFIDTTRFMASLLSNLVNNLSEGIYKIKCKYKQDDKKSETCRIKYEYCDYFLEYKNFDRIQMFILQQKVSTKVSLKLKETNY